MSTASEWDANKSLKLLDIYRNYEILWDPTHNNYKNMLIRQQALSTVADQMNMDKSEVELKFKELSSCYMREIVKERESELVDPPYKSKWYAMEAMNFLGRAPHRLLLTLLDQTDPEFYTNEKDATSDNPDASTPSDQIKDDAVNETTPKRKRIKTEDPLAGSVDGSSFRSQECASTSHDDSAAFGEYVSSKMRLMDRKTRALAQFNTHSIIFKAEMGRFKT